MKLCLFEPEIPQNVGTLLRLAACLGVHVDIIEPCGFPWSMAKLRRAGMDYLEQAPKTLWPSWGAYRAATTGRVIYLTPHAPQAYCDFEFQADDTLLLGKESTGVPAEIAATIPHRVTIPMRPEMRSLNVAVAAAMVLGEALRQTQGFPRR